MVVAAALIFTCSTVRDALFEGDPEGGFQQRIVRGRREDVVDHEHGEDGDGSLGFGQFSAEDHVWQGLVPQWNVERHVGSWLKIEEKLGESIQSMAAVAVPRDAHDGHGDSETETVTTRCITHSGLTLSTCGLVNSGLVNSGL